VIHILDIMRNLEILAALMAGAGAVAGQAMESLGPLGVGVALAAALTALARGLKVTTR